MTETLRSFDALAESFAHHGYCGILNQPRRPWLGTCSKPLLLKRDGEGRTLRMWLECPDHGRKWMGR